MHINGKISYIELEQLVYIFKNEITNSYLKKIYHYNGLWLFKFNHFSFVFEPGVSIWPGYFIEREKKLHSVSIKLRKEIGDKKLIGVDIVENDRTIVLQFREYKLILELYSKGNMILLDNDNNIIILTRIHSDCIHGKTYSISNYKIFDLDYSIKKYKWNIENIDTLEVISNKSSEYDFNNIVETLKNLWNQKNGKRENKEENKKIKKKYTPEDNISNQIINFKKKINKKNILIDKIEEDYENINYQELGNLYSGIKNIKNKCLKAEEHLEKNNKIKKNNKLKKKEKIKLEINTWYQKFHWWYTKNNFLVIGGKNSDDNEKIVKTYMKDNDFYFHTEEPGSGSFIMITENREPDFSDLDETAEGVLALSNQWNSSFSYGNVYYVKGGQVSKTPPAGEFITKGSFMIYGKKEFIKVYNYNLGYCIYDKKLLLAPYRIITRLSKINIKLSPRNDIKKMKGKIIIDSLKKILNIDIPENIFIFNKPCKIFTKN